MVEVVVVGAFLALIVGRSVMRNRDWRSVARELGLEPSRSMLGSRTLAGTFQGFTVRVKEISKDSKSRVQIEVHGVDPGFTLGRDGALARMFSPDMKVGDEIFDQKIRVQGDADRALAVLNDWNRWLIREIFNDDGGQLANGILETAIRSVDGVPDTLRSMVRLAARLGRPSDAELPERLSRQVLDGQSHGVRRTAFRHLLGLPGDLPGDQPGAESTALVTARELLGDFSQEMRVEACRALRDQPDDADRVAETLAEIVGSGEIDSATRCDALEVLADSPRRGVAVRALTEVLDADADADADSDSDAGPVPQEVQRAAVEALGRIGDLDAVPRLRRLAESGQLFRSAVARAAEAAIEEIKGRAGGSQAGEISLVSVDSLEGAVSPAEDSEVVGGGEVSLT